MAIAGLYSCSAVNIVEHACHMNRRSGVTTLHRYGGGTGPIWIDNPRCRGNEMSIADCTHDGWGVTYCSHNYDLSISCDTGMCSLSLSAVSIDLVLHCTSV